MSMSCSGETMEVSSEFIQIKPMILNQLKKAKYGVSDHGTVELCHWTKKSFKNEGDCYKMKFYGITTHRCMEFHQLECIVKTDAYTVGDQWNFTILWKCLQIRWQNQKRLFLI